MFKLTVKNNVRNPQIGKNFLIDLVKAINMSPVTKPQVVDVAVKGNEGLTGSINLATSHIAFHNWSNSGLLMLDVYSCCYFDTATVLDIVDKYWTLDTDGIRVFEVDRNNDTLYQWTDYESRVRDTTRFD